MQPQAPQKPVMDVTAPAQKPAPTQPVVPPLQPVEAPAPSAVATTASVPVHEAPKLDKNPSASYAQHARPAAEKEPAPQPKPVSPVADTQQKTKSPAAIIVTTLFIMAVLAGLTVVAYLKSQ